MQKVGRGGASRSFRAVIATKKLRKGGGVPSASLVFIYIREDGGPPPFAQKIYGYYLQYSRCSLEIFHFLHFFHFWGGPAKFFHFWGGPAKFF